MTLLSLAEVFLFSFFFFIYIIYNQNILLKSCPSIFTISMLFPQSGRTSLLLKSPTIFSCKGMFPMDQMWTMWEAARFKPVCTKLSKRDSWLVMEPHQWCFMWRGPPTLWGLKLWAASHLETLPYEIIETGGSWQDSLQIIHKDTTLWKNQN